MTKSEVLKIMGDGLRKVARAAGEVGDQFEQLAVDLSRTNRLMKRLCRSEARETDSPKVRRSYRCDTGRELPGSARTARLRKKMLTAHRAWLDSWELPPL